MPPADEQGILLSDVAVGVAPILALADHPAREFNGHAQPVLNGKAAVSL